MIDLHAHVLPGFDDGVRSLEEARALARAAAAEGVTTIAATPHVRADYPTSPDRMERGVAVLNRDFADQEIPVSVTTGGELDIQRVWMLSTEDVRRFSLGGTGRWVLVETPYAGWPDLLERTLTALRHQRLESLVAHPERNAEVQRAPSLLAPLVAEGARVQITAASLDGRLGEPARECASALVDLGLAHVLASDAHGPDVRAVGLAAAVAALGDRETAQRLVLDNPAAILAGSGPEAVE